MDGADCGLKPPSSFHPLGRRVVQTSCSNFSPSGKITESIPPALGTTGKVRNSGRSLWSVRIFPDTSALRTDLFYVDFYSNAIGIDKICKIWY
jgi:hypothetical protein